MAKDGFSPRIMEFLFSTRARSVQNASRWRGARQWRRLLHNDLVGKDKAR